MKLLTSSTAEGALSVTVGFVDAAVRYYDTSP